VRLRKNPPRELAKENQPQTLLRAAYIKRRGLAWSARQGRPYGRNRRLLPCRECENRVSSGLPAVPPVRPRRNLGVGSSGLGAAGGRRGGTRANFDSPSASRGSSQGPEVVSGVNRAHQAKLDGPTVLARAGVRLLPFSAVPEVHCGSPGHGRCDGWPRRPPTGARRTVTPEPDSHVRITVGPG